MFYFIDRIIRITLATLLLLITGVVHAMPSFSGESTFSEFSVTLENGRSQTIQILRDHDVKNHFYYLPIAPRLTSKTVKIDDKDTVVPDFSLLKFSIPDPENAQKKIEGGFMQFTVTMGLSLDQINELKTAMVKVITVDGKKVEDPSEITISQVPIKNAKIHVYDPKSGQYVATGAPEGIAPADLTQQIPFTLKFDRINTDLAAGLAGEGQGIGAIYSYDYDAVAAPRGFKVTINWDQVYSNFSSSSILKEQVRKGWWVFSWDKSKKTEQTVIAMTELKKNNAVKIEAAGMTPDEQAKYLEPLMSLVQSSVFGKDSNPVPEAIDPKIADGDMPAEPNSSVSGKVSNSASKMVIQSDRKSGTEEIDYNNSPLLPMTASSPGSLGISDQPQSIKDRLVQLIPEGSWDSAYVTLPNMVTTKEMGISEVTMTMYPSDDSHDGVFQSVVWTPDDLVNGGGGKWRDEQGKERQSVLFGLEKWRERYKQSHPSDDDAYKKYLKFKTRTQIQSVAGLLVVEQEQPAFTGNFPALSPVNGFHTVSVSARRLKFHKKPTDLDEAVVTITDPVSGHSMHKEMYSKDDRIDFVVADKSEYELEVLFEFDNDDVNGSEGEGEHIWSKSGTYSESVRIVEHDCSKDGVLLDECRTIKTR